MTDIARSDMLRCMEDLLAGRFAPEQRLMLDAEISRDGREVDSNLVLTTSSSTRGRSAA